MSIFKAYDIRGIYPNELNEESAKKIGIAYADFLGGKAIIIGRDMRLSSDSLFLSLAEGITQQGIDVIDIGIVSTPMSYFACAFLKADGSIMITASHNPKDYNGFKFTRKNAVPIGESSGLKKIEEIFLSQKFKSSSRKGRIIKKDIMQDYAKHVLSFIDSKKIKPLNIVIDAANGMGGKETPVVYSKLPCKRTELFFNLDGTFPNHEADPLKEENVAELKKAVLRKKADIGIAFDGDADRVFFVDEQGEKISSDLITCLIAEEFLEKSPKEKVLYDLRSSLIIKEKVEESGGKAIMSRVGHAFVKELMKKENAIFGGELSGHFYFRDNFYTDSGMIASLKMLEILSEKGKPLSELIKPLKKYFHSGEINSKVSDKEGKMKLLMDKYKEGKLTTIDGIRIDFQDWWFNVRPSNTEPLLRLNLEAKTKSQMEKKRDEVLDVIRG